MPSDSQRALLQDALVKIRELRAEVAALRASKPAPTGDEPIAIVGMGCRFPGGVDSPWAFLRLLREGRDAISPTPAGRWKADSYFDADPEAPGKMYTQGGGFLEDIAGFDADFFGIAPREALQLDPQQRLLLEVAWEALENSGIAPDGLAHSATGVYVGIMAPEYGIRQFRGTSEAEINAYSLTGNDISFAAGRVAYRLGLQGPALTVATACSSSLVTVHLACQALRAGECSLALAGGVNLMVDPLTSVMLSKLRALAPDGRCKTFDEAADGYGRGEGCGMVVLERVADAVAHGHRVLALVRGSAVNHDGPSAGLTVPNGPAQEKLLRQALRAAGIEPSAVGYLEAHGTGTPLGDPIEARALARVLGAARRQPLWLGSVKTNFGHLEAAAGIAGLMKATLALRHQEIFPHLHFRHPSAHIPWDELPLRVPTQLERWTAAEGERIAGVSSFGISGINAHVVLQEAPPTSPRASRPGPDRLTLSARSAEALRQQALRFAAHFEEHPDLPWPDVCHTARAGRARFSHRLEITAGSLDEARDLLLRGADPRPEVGLASASLEATTGNLIELPTYPFQRERYWALDHLAGPTPSPAKAGTRPVPPADFATAVAHVLGLAQTPDPTRSLLDLGLDSLMALELQAWAQKQCGATLELERLLSGASIADLSPALSSRAAVSQEAARVSAAAPGELSVGQKALWFIHQSAPQSPAYNVGVGLRLVGKIQTPALRAALQSLVDRHPALRTVFRGQAGHPKAEVVAEVTLPWEESDASTWSRAELSNRVAAAYRSPFDLARGPLLRAHLFAHMPGEHVLLLTLHHIACDALSFAVLLQDLQQLYAAEAAGAPKPVSPATATYADFARWQADMLASEAGQRLWAYWQQQLTGPLPQLELPLDRPRPPLQTYSGGSHTVAVPVAVAEKLRRLARERQTTPYVVLLATFYALLHRTSGQTDLIVGSAMAARPPAFAQVVGYFTNPLPLRADLSGDPRFEDLIEQLRRTVMAALDHQTMPFATLVERLRPARDPSRPPLFQVDFAVLKPPTAYRKAGPAGEPLALEPFEFPEEEGQFELGLHVADDDPGFRATFKYNSDLFEAGTIERMSDCFLALLAGIVANPADRVAALPLGTPAQRQAWLKLGIGRRFEVAPEAVSQTFERQAAAAPEAIAVRLFTPRGEQVPDGPVEFTYHELNQRANRLARKLRQLGVGPESLVGVFLERSLDLAVAILAVVKSGGAFVPLDPGYPNERLEFMARDSALPILLTTPTLAARLPELPGVNILGVEDGAGDGSNLERPPQPNSLAYVIYTSGSTGRPKGTLITHRGLTNYMNWCMEAYPVRAGTGAPVNSSIAFDATLTSFFPPLLTGGTVHLLPEARAIEALQDFLLTHRGLSLLKITPAHLEILGQLLPPDQLAGRVHALVIGGEALQGSLLRSWQEWAPATRLINEYGPTETVVGCCIYEVGERHDSAVPIGRPIANTQLYVLDARLEPVPPGVVGELYIGGDGVGRGYLNRPELTAERFLPDPLAPGGRLYRSGDRARFRADGNLEFLGRTDQQVKIRGHRIELGEIESALLAHPRVREAAALVREDQPGHPYLVAYVVEAAKLTGPPLAAELRHALAQRLPEAMVPSFVVAVPELPLTPHGKLDRTALPTPQSAAGASAYAAPRDALEMQLTTIWEQVLGVAPVGIRDNFFDLGGHSLLAVRLMSRLQEEFGSSEAAVPLSTILRGPTIEQLAPLLRHRVTGPSSALVPIQPSGSRPPFYCVPGAGGNVIYLQSLARELGSDQPFFGLQGRGLDGEAPPHTRVEEMATHYIAALRQHQPAGPYWLGGHSLGGWVVAEMAHQLHRDGQPVANLAIIDTPAPSPTPPDAEKREHWDQARWIAELAHRIAQLLNPNLILTAEALRPLSGEEQMRHFQAALVAADLFPADAGIEHLRQVLRVFQAHSQVNYELPTIPLPARVILLRTAHPPAHLPALASDPTWGWGAFAEVEVHILPGEHLSVLRAPHVQELARELAAAGR